MYGKPWTVHAEKEAWYYWSAADEGSGKGGETSEAVGKVGNLGLWCVIE